MQDRNGSVKAVVRDDRPNAFSRPGENIKARAVWLRDESEGALI